MVKTTRNLIAITAILSFFAVTGNAIYIVDLNAPGFTETACKSVLMLLNMAGGAYIIHLSVKR